MAARASGHCRITIVLSYVPVNAWQCRLRYLRAAVYQTLLFFGYTHS